MILRFLNCIEKNRKVFKFLFPPKLFAAFIDSGNYNCNLHSYQPVILEFHEMTLEEIDLIKTKIDDISKFGSMEGFTGMQPREIGNYTLVEIIVRSFLQEFYFKRVKVDMELYL